MFKSFIDNIGDLLCQPILNADTYKATHWTFEHPQFSSQYAYIEARKGGKFGEVQFFGLQYVLRYFMRQRVTMAMIDEAEAELTAHGVPFNRKMWERIVKVHKGKLPVRIKALPEGIVVPTGTVLVTIESTDPECPGLAAYVETLLLRGVWFPTTIATRSMRWWRQVNRYVMLSGTAGTTDFKVVDFSARGHTSTESAGIGGMAHLVNFQVTDNLMGIRFAKHAYLTNGMPGFSIPASEHSVTTEWGKELPGGRDGELEFFRNAIAKHGGYDGDHTPERKLVSIVIDTYDQDKAIEMWGTTLKDELIASNMTVVLRPDSGDPITNVVHVLELAGRYFGFEMNDKGFRVLPAHVRVIQGDGINEDTLIRILQRVVYHRWSIDNLVFGSGGGLMVHEVERDTHRFAMKASEVIIGGEVRAINKVVKTDASKASKKGRFAVVCRPERLVDNSEVLSIMTVAENDADPADNLLDLVYENGELVNEQTFEQVRELSAVYRAFASPEERHALIAAKLLD